jgi:hypothetical protein
MQQIKAVGIGSDLPQSSAEKCSTVKPAGEVSRDDKKAHADEAIGKHIRYDWLIAVDSLSIHTKTHQERSSLELESIHCLGDSSECSPQHHACGKPSKAAHKKAHCT